MAKRKSNFYIPTSLVVVACITLILIIVYWSKKEDINLLNFCGFLFCILLLCIRKGIEPSRDRYAEFVQVFWIRKVIKSQIYYEELKKISIIKFNKEIGKPGGWGTGYRDSVSSYSYVLSISTNSFKFDIINSSNYYKVLKYAKLFSQYYMIPIIEEDINIKYPTTGDSVDYLKTPRPKVSRKKNNTPNNDCL